MRDLGYAPTVVRHAGRFLLMGSGSELHESESPLGPFRPIGALEIPFGQGKLPVMIDPLLFSDDDGRYYLTYSSGGTQYRSYAMGGYVGDSPPGRPAVDVLHGAVRGRACFERRIGMDPAAFDTGGNLHVPAATSTPQPVSVSKAALPWVPLNDGEPTFGSSSAPNTAGRRAAADSMMTWWLPAADDQLPVLTTSFASTA